MHLFQLSRPPIKKTKKIFFPQFSATLQKRSGSSCSFSRTTVTMWRVSSAGVFDRYRRFFFPFGNIITLLNLYNVT